MYNPHFLSRLSALLMIVLILTNTAQCLALTEEGIRGDLAEAYEAVYRAEAAGGDIHELIPKLDEAARLIQGASPASMEQAKTLIDQVKTQVPQIQTQGEQTRTNRLYLTAAALIIIGSLIIIIWRRGSHWFFNSWLKTHKGWVVEKT